MDPSREGQRPEETNSETTFPRKMQVCQPSPQKPYFYHASSMPRKKGMSLSSISQTQNASIQMQVEDEEDMAIIKICGVLWISSFRLLLMSTSPTSQLIRRDETVTGTVPECPIWYNGCKPTVLSQIHQESDECQIRNQPI
jgi:hypothetical protein